MAMPVASSVRNFACRHASRYMLVLVLWCCVAIAVRAEHRDDLFDLSLQQLMNIKVSSPTLTPQTLQDTPAAVSVFQRDEIQRTGFDYLHELLNLVPGFQVIRSGDGPFSVSARGRANYSNSREILVLVDGIPRNDPRDGGARSLLHYFPLERIERVEIVRGPGSALYGANAFTGVVNIVTRAGVNEAGLAAGSHDRVHLHGLANAAWQQWNMDGFVRAEQDRGDHFRVPDSFGSGDIDTRDPIRNLDAALSVGNDSTRISASWLRRHAEDFYFSETTANGLNKNTEDYTAVTLEHRLQWLDAVDAHLLAGWQHREQEYWVQGGAAGSLAAISLPSSDAPLIGNGSIESTVWEAYWRNDWSPADGLSLQFGLDWREESDDRSRLDSNFNLDQLFAGEVPVQSFDDTVYEIRLSAEDTRRVLGGYLQYQQDVGTDTRLTLSLRHDDYSNVASRTTPRIGVVHRLAEQHTVKLLYAEAFRVPALTETGLGQYLRLAGNPDLEHEVVKTWDAIWQYDADTLMLTAGWFQNHFEDPVIVVQRGSTRTFANGDSESSEGLELVTRWQPIRPLQLRATLTHFSDLPASAFREAQTLASLMVNVRHANWNFNLAAVHHSAREMLTPVDGEYLLLDPYWQVNTKLLFEAGAGVQWWLQAKNLLDEAFMTPMLGNRSTEGVPNRRREIGLGIQWHY